MSLTAHQGSLIYASSASINKPFFKLLVVPFLSINKIYDLVPHTRLEKILAS